MIQYLKNQSISRLWQMYTEKPRVQALCAQRVQLEHFTHRSPGLLSLKCSKQTVQMLLFLSKSSH